MSDEKKKGGKRAAIDKDNVVLQKLQVTYVPIDSVKPNDYNPNRQSDHDFEMLCQSIVRDGFTQPIIVHKDTKEIVDGEHRWRALRALGYTECAVVLTSMSAAQMRISTIRHNQARGNEDANLAADVFRQLAEAGALDMAKETLGLDDLDVKRMLEMSRSEAADIEANIPEEMLGPSGHGLAAGDNSDTTADALRAKERLIQQAKTNEEKTMVAQDNRVYQLVCHFTGDEAEIVRKILHPDNAANLLKICQEEVAAGRA